MQWLIRSVCLAILGGLSYIAVIWGVANIHYFAVYNAMVEWEKKKTTSLPALSTAQEHADVMLNLSGNNAHYHVTQAKLYEWFAFYLDEEEQSKRDYLYKAINHYETAGQLRPSWPETWINLVAIKAQLKEFDEQAKTYIEKAQSTAPHNPRLDTMMTSLLLLHWQHLDESFIDLAFNHLQLALLRGNGAELSNYAQHIGRHALFCSYIRVRKFDNLTGEICTS